LNSAESDGQIPEVIMPKHYDLKKERGAKNRN